MSAKCPKRTSRDEQSLVHRPPLGERAPARHAFEAPRHDVQTCAQARLCGCLLDPELAYGGPRPNRTRVSYTSFVSHSA